jgi:hypothetical protein
MPPFGSKHTTASRKKKGARASRATVTRSSSVMETGSPQSPGLTSSDDDEGKVKRPARDKVLHITKEEFYEQMVMAKHPIIHDEDRLEKAYRYIDIANSMMEKKTEEKLDRVMAEKQDEMDAKNNNGKADREAGPAFFRGNMSTTIMLNGVDQIAEKLDSPTWGKAIWDLYRGTGVAVQDVWGVKKENNRVVSVLVKFSTRYQKTAAISIVNEIRADIVNSLPNRTRVRVSARDAFPKDQMEKVQECYTRGYALKKAGKIQSYRIYNTGAEEPTFEVRTLMGGKQIWGPAPSLSEESLRREETRRGSKDGAGSRERDSQHHQVIEVEDEMMHGDPVQQDTN